MPDSARVAQAEALEVAVAVQGSTTDAATGHRDLFSESAKTILVFPDGAALNLRTRVAVGQMVFLRNEQSGREILCKVVEAPPPGQTGHTELQFTAFDPDFWARGAAAAQPEASAPGAGAVEIQPGASAAPGAGAATIISDEGPAPLKRNLEAGAEPEGHAEPEMSEDVEARAEAEAPAENSLEMMGENAFGVKLPSAPVPELDPLPAPMPELNPSTAPAPEKPKGAPREELVAAHEVVSPVAQDAAPQTESEQTAPTGEQIDAALRAIATKDAHDEQSRAALARREARLSAHAAAKEKAASGAGEPGAGDASELGEAPKAPLTERLTTGKNLVISEIVLCVAIVIALGFVWHAISGLFFHPSYGPAASATVARPKSNPAAVAPGPEAAPAVTAVAAVSRAKATAMRARPNVARAPAAPVAKSTAPTRAPAASAADGKGVGEIGRPLVASSAPTPAPPVEPDADDSGPRVVEPPPPVGELEEPEVVAPKTFENVPAGIVAASQPPLPHWARALGIDGVVRLDAVIDERGNLAGARVLSGPEALRNSAINAVQIWLFAPALVNGRPARTHMILTVQFQR